MKVVILAGGRGMRLAEETDDRPKPMVTIGGIPILHHIMSHYARYDFTDFALALGYRGEDIARYMRECIPSRDPGTDTGSSSAGWTVDPVDTGETTETGGRIKRLAPQIGSDTFMLTYGDGVSDIDLGSLLAFHRAHGKLATLTAVHPPPRFGRIDIVDDRVASFDEKPEHDGGWINGGFFVLEPAVLDFIDGDGTKWEREPLERLTAAGQLMAYRHGAFWQCMDTLNDRRLLEKMWREGRAPWRASL